jgi:hypothetical protein
MYSIELKTHFFENFKNSTAFSLNNIVILLNFILKTTLIARRVSIFINYLRKSRPLSFYIKIDGENNLFYSRAIIERNKSRNRSDSYFKGIYNELLLRVPNKSDSFSH